jgi:PadR family transcriptional regulator PadR
MISSDAIRGHLESIVLSLLLEQDRYGYEISKEIKHRTNNSFQIKEASMYAVFQRLEKKDLIQPYYGNETKGGKRKYYKITTLGKAYLNEKIDEWAITKRVVNVFIGGKTNGS